MARTSKYLAQSNKSLRRGQAKKDSEAIPARYQPRHDRAIMRVKFEAIDATGKVHKRSSTSHIYSHCVVIHFVAHLPGKLWPTEVAGSHAEWVESCVLADRRASRWRREPWIEAIEILEARQV